MKRTTCGSGAGAPHWKRVVGEVWGTQKALSKSHSTVPSSVPDAGLEPARLSTMHFECTASTDSANPARHVTSTEERLRDGDDSTVRANGLHNRQRAAIVRGRRFDRPRRPNLSTDLVDRVRRPNLMTDHVDQACRSSPSVAVVTGGGHPHRRNFRVRWPRR